VALRILRDAVHENYALDAVCYSIVLHGLLHAHLVEEACRLFDQMKRSGMTSNICAYNVMLRGLCKARDMNAVKQLLTEMECFDVALDSTSFNSVFVLLSKSRCTSSFLEVVRQMLHLGMKQGSAHEVVKQMLGLGMKLDTEICSVLSLFVS
jgi:pentatricopeptide repeat protein